ncbi:alpha/beta fold hydrolase [Paenibacillus cymbidii]|uniref:alpha/beta fold hydrolase n=1 Tax=Paenibacillus cymbidii TaxID=1639034 RepID=UPI00108085E1|nr:alpha/beta hydrolase [Paenibacillus cymbidii]
MEKKQWTTSGGPTIAYREYGLAAPGRPALVLLHGFCGSAAYWDEVVPMLGDERRIVVPDLRGHGDSEAPEGPYSTEAMADDIASLLGGLLTEPAVVLGHSLGGYVTLALAERYPEQLAAFGLIHSTAYPDDEKGKAGRDKSMATIREQGIGPFVEGLVPKLFAPPHLESMSDDVQDAIDIGYGTSANGAIATLQAMKDRIDRNHVLSGSRKPVLLVAGVADGIIPPERTFSASGEQIRRHTILGAGHMSLMEAPEELAQVIASFLTTLEHKPARL